MLVVSEVIHLWNGRLHPPALKVEFHDYEDEIAAFQTFEIFQFWLVGIHHSAVGSC
jgi:hypothetical protein